MIASADAADARAAQAAAALDALPSLEVLVPARDAHVDRATLLARIETGNGEHARLTAEAAAVRDVLVAAQHAVAEAETAVDEANRQHAHAELRATLAVGDACPVCEQVVTALPPRVSTAAATKARKALDAARHKARQADEQARVVLTQLERATAQLESLRERSTALDATIEAYADRAALDATIETVRARAEAGKQARAEVERNKAALAAATERVRAAEQRLERDEQTFQRQRDALVAAGLDPPTGGDGDLLVRWQALAAFATDRLPEIEKQAALAHERQAAVVAERAATVGALAERARSLDALNRDLADLADLATAVTGAHRDAQHAVEQREQQQCRATELDAEITAARADEHVARELGRLLDRKHFRQWVVDEALRGLVGGASTVLREISSGQYSLAVAGDGDLVVVDHVNADETRSVHSLSGGETFQASLALALALADRIGELAADTAAPLESIFLDEGFGALDPESLDIVASTIESLARADRIVGVVTHVRALAERMPVRFRVQKVSGASTVVREDT